MTETSYAAEFGIPDFGVETFFSEDIPSLLSFNISNGDFDFVVAPLMNPSYRPSLVDENNLDSHFLPFAGSDIVVTPSEWSRRVIGKISSWIDLDSDDEVLRMDSETTLKQEIAWANHLSLRACLLPTPKGTSFANYARIVKQILQGRIHLELWLRIPLWDPIDPTDSWKLWNSFRSLCDHNSELFVALDVESTQPINNSLGRWFGEPVKAAIMTTECFLPVQSSGQCMMLKSYQELTTRFFQHNVQIIISGRRHVNITEGTQAHPQKPHLDYVTYLYDNMKPLSEQERIVFHNRDCLYKLIQPLRENLEAISYKQLERDHVKYIQYRKAIAKALEDRVPNGKASELTTVLMVVGAGRGPLVFASLQAAKETGRKLKVYAVEKNPNAVVSLHDLVKKAKWEGTVIVISSDMRFWSAPERADILVSDLLGFFGDNELSPECLDGAQRFLKPDGISIPSSYTSFIQPITTTKVYNAVKALKNLYPFETAYSVKLHNVATLAPVQPVFTFVHPNLSSKINNQYYKKLRFDVPKDMGSTLVHGFAGYFDAVLYDDVHVSNKPTTATQNRMTRFPIFFPLNKPVEVASKSPIETHFWRCSDSTKVWYEWTVTLPTALPIHNTNGHSYSIAL